MLHDAYGPHQRLVFARHEIAELAGVPESDWVDPDRYIRLIHSGFPNLSISGVLGDHALVSQVYPGPTMDTTVTTFVFGRNEIAVQHYHAWVARLAGPR